MSGSNKDSKDKKRDARDDLGATVRRLADEMNALRAEWNAARQAAPPEPSEAPGPLPKDIGASLEAGDTLPNIPDASVARLGYAFSSIPKVSLLRLLFTAGESSAADLGVQAGLTTGSLYHHLRELIHAGVITQSSRNRYALTPSGRRAVYLVFAVTPE